MSLRQSIPKHSSSVLLHEICRYLLSCPLNTRPAPVSIRQLWVYLVGHHLFFSFYWWGSNLSWEADSDRWQPWASGWGHVCQSSPSGTPSWLVWASRETQSSPPLHCTRSWCNHQEVFPWDHCFWTYLHVSCLKIAFSQDTSSWWCRWQYLSCAQLHDRTCLWADLCEAGLQDSSR